MKKETIYGIFSHIPVLTTERLTMRQMKVSDTEDMYEYAKNPEVTRYLTWRPHTTRDYTKQYLEYIGTRYNAGDFYDWAITEKDSGKMIGTCGFTRFDLPNNSAEIGYVLNPSYQRRGLATEAARAIMEFGFGKLGLHRIEARFMTGNDASRRVMEKLGMKYEGTLREAYYINGSYRTVSVYSALAPEFG